MLGCARTSRVRNRWSLAVVLRVPSRRRACSKREPFPENRGPMPIHRIAAVLVIIPIALSGSFAQNMPSVTGRAASSLAADESNQPKLEHFDPNLVDKSLDPDRKSVV